MKSAKAANRPILVFLLSPAHLRYRMTTSYKGPALVPSGSSSPAVITETLQIW